MTLRGEIVDSKCYLGAMKPGAGRVHRACAQICLEGGIPPVLVVRDASGKERHYVLTSQEGGPVHREVLPFVAEPVSVAGSVVRRAGVNWLSIDPEAIERL